MSGRYDGERVRFQTGRDWEGWYGLLDAWGARDRPHAEIAEHLHRDVGLDGWWAQMVTVEYEIHIGRRIPGQSSKGDFQFNVSRTVDTDPEALWDRLETTSPFVGGVLFGDMVEGEAYITPEGPLELRVRTEGKKLRCWQHGLEARTIVEWVVEPTPSGKARILVGESGLPSLEERERRKALWGNWLQKHFSESE